MKKCTKCGIEKELDQYHKNKLGAFGRNSKCKECVKKYLLQNKDKIKKQRKHYRDKNKDKILSYAKEYRKKNKDSISEKKKIHNSKPEVKEARKKYYEENKTKILSRMKKLMEEKKKLEPSCVYQIVCSKNNFAYIGQTTRGKLRWEQHLRRLKGNYHPNKKLQEDFIKYGECSFEWSIIKTTEEQILLFEEAREIQRRINNGEDLYNLVLTVEQLKLLNENQEKK